MSKYPVRLAGRVLPKVEKDAVEVMGPASEVNAFVSFRYSCTEISALGGKAHVKSKKARLEDGKLTSETFDGEIEWGAYEHLVRQAQRHFLGQTMLLLQSLSWFLPPARKQSPDRD